MGFSELLKQTEVGLDALSFPFLGFFCNSVIFNHFLLASFSVQAAV